VSPDVFSLDMTLDSVPQRPITRITIDISDALRQRSALVTR
jgi:hypothetical protein